VAARPKLARLESLPNRCPALEAYKNHHQSRNKKARTSEEKYGLLFVELRGIEPLASKVRFSA